MWPSKLLRSTIGYYNKEYSKYLSCVFNFVAVIFASETDMDQKFANNE